MRTAATAIDDLIKNVESLIPDLANIGQNNTGNGRFTKQAGYALLAEMYLNRAVYKDRYNTSGFNFSEAAVDNNGTDMDKVISYTSQLIGSGQFKLESNFFHNFDIQNANGTELIFSMDHASRELIMSVHPMVVSKSASCIVKRLPPSSWTLRRN